MSEAQVQVVRLGPIEKHPNADSLGITQVYGYPVVVRLGDFQEGDLAVYAPVDSVFPKTPEYAFLGSSGRVKAKKLRGVFSMGLLVKAPVGLEAGAPAAQAMGITWYTPPQDIPGGTDEQDLHYMPVYTDIEGLRRYQDVLVAGEDVVFVEKIHGECARVAYRDSRLYVGSRTRVKKRGSGGWWLAAMNGNLEEKLKYFPNLVFYGESHGYTGRYPYGTNKRPAFKCFDIFDPALGRYLDFDDFEAVCKAADIPMAPVLYRGPFSMQTALLHSDGPSTIDPTHTREGVVIRPTKERWHETIGRVILKLHGETFLLKE